MDHLGSHLTSILVTGAAGYLGGQVLATAKARGLAVVGTARMGSDELRACDLRDCDATTRMVAETGAGIVIHCAAHVPKVAADYADATAADDSLRMVDALIAARPRRVVFASSMTVYGPATSMPAREETADGGTTAYSRAKLKSEHRLLAEIDDVICLRFPGLFGPPRKDGLLHTVASDYNDGRKPRLTQSPPTWAALHVEDAVDLCLRAALREEPVHVAINAGYPEPMSVALAVRELARRFEQPPPELSAPIFEMHLSRLIETLGLPDSDFAERLDALCQAVRKAA